MECGNLCALRQNGENFVEDKLFLQILINIHRPVFLQLGRLVMPWHIFHLQ